MQGRVLIELCDLFAEEAVYHKNCHTNFFRLKVYEKPGRPVESMKADTFEKVCDWLEVNDTELVTLQDIVDKAMVMVPDNSHVYSKEWMKRKLIDSYGDHIQFCEVLGKCNVNVCWKDMASYIINKKWHDDSACNQSEHIVFGNDKNKAAFVSLLVESLQTAGYEVQQAMNDADTLIVKVALDLATKQQVVGVIATDTDVLVMLVAHYKQYMNIYMYAGAKHSVYCIGDIFAKQTAMEK